MSSNRVLIGRVGRPHGLDGCFVVEDASEASGRWAVGSVVLAGGEAARVEESKRAGGRVVVRLDRTVARGAALEVEPDSLPPPDDDSFYVFQLVGLEVAEQGGRRLGRVAEVRPGAANDVLELDSGLSLPLAESCVLDVDVAGGCILVATGFADPEDA
jgi:16S rRNA processing protein RimM